MTAYGITGFGAYVPRLRIERTAIADAHSWMNPGLRGAAKGTRAFCSWDEDAITMAVEAGRDCLRGGDKEAISSLRIASTTFPYSDLSNGVIVGSALGLRRDLFVSNGAGSQRAATSALIEGLRAGAGEGLVIASEKPVHLPASGAEMQSGAGAAAVRLGDRDVIATLLASTSRAAHFVDHFRSSGNMSDYVWEERWIRDEGYSKLVPEAVKAVLADAGVSAAEVQHLILPSPIRGVAAMIAKLIGFGGTVADGLEAELGYCGAAHGLLMLANTLANAKAGDRILMVSFGQGVDVLLFEATGASGQAVAGRGVAGAIADGLLTTDYLRMLSFADQITLEWGMRGEKSGKAALTEQYRSAPQLDTFTGGRCGRCGTVQFPILAYCVKSGCAAPAAQFEPAPLSEEPAKILTVTSDWLSYHPAPPLAVGFVQFDNGARLLMEIVDARAEQITEGTSLRMVFRIKERDKLRGFNRYFWKATPATA